MCDNWYHVWQQKACSLKARHSSLLTPEKRKFRNVFQGEKLKTEKFSSAGISIMLSEVWKTSTSCKLINEQQMHNLCLQV